MILNIIDNSLKYRAKERGLLEIKLTAGDGSCSLVFADDGSGVPEDALARLFDVFYRTDASRSDRSKGSGLGLAIVEKTVKRMNGSVCARNNRNGGLSIMLELPAADDPAADV